jgi:hypothetical protein
LLLFDPGGLVIKLELARTLAAAQQKRKPQKKHEQRIERSYRAQFKRISIYHWPIHAYMINLS